MESELIKTYKDTAEIYRGKAVCNKKICEILESHSLPNGLFPIDIIELGHNKPAGFVWIKQQQKTEKMNPHLNKLGSYDAEITFFIEKGRMKKQTGLKAKELFIWLAVSDVYVEDPSSGKITFKSYTGISRKVPISAFQIKEVQNADQFLQKFPSSPPVAAVYKHQLCFQTYGKNISKVLQALLLKLPA